EGAMGANRHMSVDSRGRCTPEVFGEVLPGSEGPAGSRSHNLNSTRRASLMQEPVLVLNATYEPINVTAVRRAMVLMLKGVAQAQGGRSTWENVVACCYRCNNSKGGRTPEEAGLKLARRPRPFTLHTSRQLMRLIGHRDERWRKYLFY